MTTLANRQGMGKGVGALRSLRSRRSGLLRTEPPSGVSALREPATIASDSFTLTEAIAACEAAIEANRTANVDKIGRRLLDASTETLRRYLRWAKREVARPYNEQIPHLFAVTWHGPALADVIASSAFHREHSKMGRAA